MRELRLCETCGVNRVKRPFARRNGVRVATRFCSPECVPPDGFHPPRSVDTRRERGAIRVAARAVSALPQRMAREDLIRSHVAMYELGIRAERNRRRRRVPVQARQMKETA